MTLSNRYHGSGNSFLIYENEVPGDPIELCRCGVDGVLLLKGDCYSIYNADGSEALMCGNGVRCMVRFLEERGRRQEHYVFQTLAGTVEAWHEGELIGVKMPSPLFHKTERFRGKEADFYTVGNPHIVLFFDEVGTIDIEMWGHPDFNVNLVQVKGDSLFVRTFERGVGRETLSCGTGATASAAAAKRRLGLGPEIEVYTQSKSSLTIRFLEERVEMVGPALCINSP